MADPFRLIYAEQTEIPETQREHYLEQDDGTWRLNVQGAVPKKTHDEFRETNVSLRKEIEKLKEQVGESGNTAKENADLKKKIGDLEGQLKKREDDGDTGALTEERIAELVAERTKAVVAERDKGYEERDGRVKQLTTELRQLRITSKIQDVASGKKLRPWAVADAVTLGDRVFDIDDDGKVFAYGADDSGKRIKLYDVNGEPMTIDSWLDAQVAARPEWRESSAGGGATNNSGGSSRRNGTSGQKKSEMSAKERSAFIEEHGREAYAALPR